MSLIDLSRMGRLVAKLRKKILVLADLAKFTKTALKTVECYLKVINTNLRRLWKREMIFLLSITRNFLFRGVSSSSECLG